MSANNHTGNREKPYILGLTGGIATGKTEAAKQLSALGALVIDSDVISHQLTAPGGSALGAIRERFGDEVFLEDGTLDRKMLGKRVFSDESERLALEAILHPAVQKEMVDQMEAAEDMGVKVCVLVVPLLFETGMDVLCDEVWVMSVDRTVQECRVTVRDKIDIKEARERIASQMSPEVREENADVVIRTDRPMPETAKEIKKQYEALLKRI